MIMLHTNLIEIQDDFLMAKNGQLTVSLDYRFGN